MVDAAERWRELLSWMTPMPQGAGGAVVDEGKGSMTGLWGCRRRRRRKAACMAAAVIEAARALVGPLL